MISFFEPFRNLLEYFYFSLPQVTGSGKTLAFVIPIIEILLRREEKLKRMQVSSFLFKMEQDNWESNFF